MALQQIGPVRQRRSPETIEREIVTGKKSDQERIDRFLHTLMESEAMNEMKQYLERGRKLAPLDSDELKKRWTTAFKTWFASRKQSDARKMDDAAAELRLRKLEVPFETVRSELALGRLEIQKDGPEKLNLKPKIAAFLDEIDREPN